MINFLLWQPTVSPASSADMAPISSGSSTWTSSGIPFSFVSMATGIGPSSSGSQATVASLVTSTLLAGLGFSGGVISSFPSSVWPSGAATRGRQSARQAGEPAKDSGDAGGEDRENSQGQGEEEEEKKGEEKDEGEDEDEKKKKRKTSGRVGGTAREENSTAKTEPSSDGPDATAKEKKAADPDTEKQLEAYTHNPLHKSATSTQPVDATAEFPVLEDPAVTLGAGSGRDKQLWPFYIHMGKSANRNNSLRQ